MSTRRSFIKQAAGFAGAFSFLEMTNSVFASEFQRRSEKNLLLPPEAVSSDEDFWGWVKEQYTVSANIINLNNGGVSPQPKSVQDAHIKYYQFCNDCPSYNMWDILDQGREPLRAKLADLAGCDPEEIAINRNSTEGLNDTIFGLKFKPGDEVVASRQDYPHTIHAWKQREKRDGIKVNFLFFDLPIEDENKIIKQYTDAFTDKTKAVFITHLVSLTGQIFPAKEIAAEAHKRGIEVILDTAQGFAHFDFKLPEMECDYAATSLHKWLCAPFGTGMLYIKRDKIKNVWPLHSSKIAEDDIRKFEEIGTRSFPSEMAIGAAIDFHNIIGSKRKEERLRYLKNYWVDKVAKNPKIKFYVPKNQKYSCAMCMFSLDGWTKSEAESRLFDKYKIHTLGLKWENIEGVRVTPHLYTTTKDLDRLVLAIDSMSKEK